jgi:hypothetical protein
LGIGIGEPPAALADIGLRRAASQLIGLVRAQVT